MKKILTSKQVALAIERLHKSVVAQLPDDARLAIIGIRTRGQTIANRLAEIFREKSPKRQFDQGVLDITFYRDDLAQRSGAAPVRATEIDFDLNDAWVLLIDDVLHTGRSTRAALDALHDFGRPRVIRLGVLIDRGGRELPIAADFAGQKVLAEDNQIIKVRLKENDGEEGVYIGEKEE